MKNASTPPQPSEGDLQAQLQMLCKMHNEVPGTLTDYDCLICKNKGLLFVLSGMCEVARQCSCMPVRESIRRMKHSGLYGQMQTKTFLSYRVTQPWQKLLHDRARQFAEKHDMPGFFIGGQQGCGKTHLCTAICGSLLRQGLRVQYFVWETYVKEILSRSGVSDRDERESLMRPLMEADAVYLDDFLRKDCPTQAERSVAFDVVNRRCTEGRITIVSSEKEMDALLMTDQAIASRIREMCGADYCLGVAPDRKKNYRLPNPQLSESPADAGYCPPSPTDSARCTDG